MSLHGQVSLDLAAWRSHRLFALDDPGSVTRLLQAFRFAGAEEQAIVLADRAAAHAALDNPAADPVMGHPAARLNCLAGRPERRFARVAQMEGNDSA